MMNILILALALIGYVEASNDLYLFKTLKLSYNKTYGENEDLHRQKVFINNFYELEEYEKYNYFNMTYSFNEFIFLEDDEFYDMYLKKKKFEQKRRGNLRISHHKIYHNSNNENLPIKVDWRLFNILSPVVKQGEFNSSTQLFIIELIETLYSYVKDLYIELSVDELIDCVGVDDVNVNFNYIMQNGISFKEDYDIEYQKNYCNTAGEDYAISIQDYHIIPENNEKELMYIVSQHPVIVTIDASMPFFRFYKGGIIQYKQYPECGKELNHVVMLVGYGDENGIPYWILKNSWGEDWGEDGYFRIERGVNAFNGGVCGILKRSYYPIIE